jgi:hypothetical protein
VSSPVEQYVPIDFQDTIDVGASPIDQGAVSKSKAVLAKASLAAKRSALEVSALQGRLKTKGLSDKAKGALEAKLKLLQQRDQFTQKIRTAAQNRVYETSGQYEKLLSGENRDAYAALRTMFAQYGLDSLAPKIYDYAKNGYGADAISLLLQGTKEYKTRFAANDLRAAKGLSVLTPAEYLSTESAYRQLMQDSGMPKGYYDNPADFQKWIADDVSPTEVKGRIDLAVASTSQANTAVKQQLAALYGVDEKYLTAYFFDRTKSLPLLQKQEKTAEFSAEAAKRGLLTDRARFEGYITSGLTQSAASQGFQTVASELPNLDAIAQRFGTTFGQAEEEGAVFGTSSASAEKRTGLASQERAQFASSRGASAGGLSSGYRQT